MRTVPLGAAETLLGSRPDLLEVCSRAGVSVGVRTEIDLGALPASLRAVLGGYYEQCSALWSTLEAGDGAGAYVSVSRRVRDHHQVTAKCGRAYLGAVFADAGATAELAGALRVVTGRTAPCGTAMVSALSAVGASLVDEDGDSVRAVVNVAGSHAWPSSLGGCAGPGEVSRAVTMAGRRAQWRDTRVLRLAGLCVDVQELWAEPAVSSAALVAVHC